MRKSYKKLIAAFDRVNIKMERGLKMIRAGPEKIKAPTAGTVSARDMLKKHT